MKNADIARVCHEANRALQITLDEEPSNPWLDTDEDMRQSVIIGVQHALEGATAEQLHESWCETKLKQGWSYGGVKDAEAKTHPCLVPYGELPAEQRIKDDLFKAVVRALGEVRL